MQVRNWTKQQKGTTIVELSLVIVAFLVLMIGMMDVGRAVWCYNSISSVARNATRHAIVHGNRSADPCDATEIQDFVRDRLVMSDVTVNTTWDPDNTQGSMVTVTVSYPFQPVVALFNPVTISATSEMAISY